MSNRYGSRESFSWIRPNDGDLRHGNGMHEVTTFGKKGDVLAAERRQGSRDGVHTGCMSMGSAASCDLRGVSKGTGLVTETIC